MAKKIFTEKQREIIARKLGYDGPMSEFDKFVRSDPAMEQKVRQLAVKIMARGGVVQKFASGGTPIGFFPGATPDIYRSMGNEAMAQKLEIALAAPSTPTPTLQAGPTNVGPAAPASTTVGSTPSGVPITASPTVYASGPSSDGGPAPAAKSATATSTANITLDQLYDSILGRKPDAEGEKFYTQKYGSTIDPSEVADFVSGIGPGESVTKEQAAQKAQDIITQMNQIATTSGGGGGAQTTTTQTQTSAPAGGPPPASVLGFSLVGYSPGVPGAWQSTLKREIGSSAYVPGNNAAAQGASAKVGGIQMVPGGPGWDEQSKDPAIVAKRDEILKTQIAPNDPGVRAYLWETGQWDETAQNAYAKQVEEDAKYEAVRQAVVAGTVDPNDAQAIVEGKLQMPTDVKVKADTLSKNVLDGTASISTIKPSSNLPTTAVRTPTTDIAGVSGQTAYATAPTEKPTFAPATMDVAKIGTAGTEQLLSTEGRDVAATTVTDTTKAAAPDAATAATAVGKTSEISAVTTEDKVKTAGANAITGTLSESAKAAAAEETPSETALKDLEEAKLSAPREVAGVPERTLTAGELVSGSAVNQAQIDAAVNKAEAATAAVKPEMTVQGQLDKLLVDFDSGNPPAWAASSMRNANAVLAARGLGASSLAGQAIIQATLEAAVPIAAQDAQTVANLELQNLSNRQQIAVLVAQQRAAFLGQEFDQAFQTRVTNAARIADIANLNFSAEQQIALENARLAQSVDLANLSNEQAVIMARAAQVANLESANLNNRQQAALQNAQAFLQLDITNLNNRQQTALFNAEKNIQAMFTDAAAQNAAKQFNATSEMQVNQFYDSLAAQVSQFNVSQKSAIEQFNAGQENAIAQFNATARNAVEQFNAQNRLIIDQSNAEWRRNISTIDTAAQNTANQFNAQAELQVTIAELNNTWQVYRDNMEYAFNSGQNALDRENKLALQVLANEATILAADKEVDSAMWTAGGMLTAVVAKPFVESWAKPSGGGGGGGGTNTVTYGTGSWADTFGTSSISTGGVSFDDVDSYIDYGAGL